MSSSPPLGMPLITLALDAIIPYWRNPRIITEESVNAVAESIKRYGYVQPIVVDAEHVIVIGHTRYAALRRLGVEEIPVAVVDLPPDRARQLRVMDNRVREYTSWDLESLSSELSELDRNLMLAYFPEARPPADSGPDANQLLARDTSAWDDVDRRAEFVCPSCFHTFEIEVSREAVLAGHLEVTEDAAKEAADV